VGLIFGTSWRRIAPPLNFSRDAQPLTQVIDRAGRHGIMSALVEKLSFLFQCPLLRED
jgi:hypothetical protein